MDDYKVFISYSSKQEKIAVDVQRYLKSNGVKCWMDKEIRGGQVFSEELAKAIKTCDIVVVVCSELSCNSEWVFREVSFAINNKKIIVPFFIEEFSLPENFSMVFANVQVINAYPNYEEKFPDLLRAILFFEGNQSRINVEKNCNLKFTTECKRQKYRTKLKMPIWILASFITLFCVLFLIVRSNRRNKVSDNRGQQPEVIVDVTKEKIDIYIDGKIGYSLKFVEGRACGSNASGNVLDSFYIGETEVTNLLWKVVMGESIEDGDYPISNVTYREIEEVFLPKLCSLTGASFRLPTEDEWEYAAKGGNYSKGFIYSGSNTIGEVAWYRDNSDSLRGNDEKNAAKRVKLQKPNEIGLYDMSGNVWEWCGDLWPESESVKNHHVIRGGGWNAIPQDCEVSCRSNNNRHARSYSRQPGNDVGFRIVLPK